MSTHLVFAGAPVLLLVVAVGELGIFVCITGHGPLCVSHSIHLSESSQPDSRGVLPAQPVLKIRCSLMAAVMLEQASTLNNSQPPMPGRTTHPARRRPGPSPRPQPCSRLWSWPVEQRNQTQYSGPLSIGLLNSRWIMQISGRPRLPSLLGKTKGERVQIEVVECCHTPTFSTNAAAYCHNRPCKAVKRTRAVAFGAFPNCPVKTPQL